MSSTLKDPVSVGNAVDSLAGDDRWKLVLRVSASKEFSRTVKLRAFLQYVCRNSLTGQMEDLHEQQIGQAVFGRRPDYNPAEDNIVRVEARELRKRLDQYFSRKSGAEPIRITVPKGRYSALFEPNVCTSESKKSPAVAHDGSKLQAPGARAIGKVNGGAWGSFRQWGIVAVLSLALAMLSGLFWVSGRADGPSSGVAASSDAPAAAIWSMLFPVKSALNIVSADSSLVLVEYISHKKVSLSDYLNGQYGKDPAYPVLKRIAPNPYIDLSDLRVTAKIMRAIRPLDLNVHVRYPRYLNLNALDTKNLVFLGSAYSDPWITKFHSQMNFVVQMDQSSENLCFENKNPAPGELNRYCASGGPGQEDGTYGLITLLPNLQNTGNVLMLAGTTGPGTEAAGDFVTDPHFAASIRQCLHLKPEADSLPYFQIMIKTVVLKNNPGTLEVVAHRIISHPGY